MLEERAEIICAYIQVGIKLISLTQAKNVSESKTEPCGTPHEIFFETQIASPMLQRRFTK